MKVLKAIFVKAKLASFIFQRQLNTILCSSLMIKDSSNSAGWQNGKTLITVSSILEC